MVLLHNASMTAGGIVAGRGVGVRQCAIEKKINNNTATIGGGDSLWTMVVARVGWSSGEEWQGGGEHWIRTC